MATLAGQPPLASDQGQSKTCTGHSVTKCVVAALDHQGFDCNQAAIQTSLQQIVQPCGDPKKLTDYHKVESLVKVWEKGEVVASWRNIMLHVSEGEKVDVQWKPPLGLENLTKSNQHVVAVARYGNEDHAMYVKKITKSFGNYQFHCLNSWGQLHAEAEPVLNAVTQVHQVHYISVISAQLPETEAARDRRIRGERMDAAPSSTPPAASDLPAPSENLNLNTDQQKVSYHYWLCYCTDQDVGCKNLVFQICCKT